LIKLQCLMALFALFQAACLSNQFLRRLDHGVQG